MPVMDYIRARVRQPDCLYAVFPDNGGSVFSPMNNQVFPIPGSATGSTDIKDGLLTLTKFGSRDVFDHQQTFNTGTNRVSPGDDAYIASNLDIRGMTPNHTVVMRMGRIPRDRFSGTTVFGFTADRPYVDSTNITLKMVQQLCRLVLRKQLLIHVTIVTMCLVRCMFHHMLKIVVVTIQMGLNLSESTNHILEQNSTL